MTIKFTAIGRIHTPHKTKEGMPIQSISAKGIKGRIELKEEYLDGLLDLDGFSHIVLIYHFHKSVGYKLQVIPFLDNMLHGVFSTRAPKRPNAIGMSVVKLIRIKGNSIEIENVDMIDGTPLLDIKPYIPEFDIHEIEKGGWLEKKTGKLNDMKSDNRFN